MEWNVIEMSINKNLYDFSIFLTHTRLQIILSTGNSASLLLQDFYSECWFLTLTLVMWPLSERKMEPALFEKGMAFCQTLTNSKKILFMLSVGMDAFQFNKELFKSSCPFNKKSPSQMRTEWARINKCCLNKCKQVSVDEAQDKKVYW